MNERDGNKGSGKHPQAGVVLTLNENTRINLGFGLGSFRIMRSSISKHLLMYQNECLDYVFDPLQSHQ